jgi:hypothetical protein
MSLKKIISSKRSCAQNGESYKAETQALFANSSLGKYTAGKKVYVKFNPQDKTQVALIGSAEE